MTKPLLANFLIAGTEKAGTTSVFVYLSQHPEVCASSRKETDFFRVEYTGDRDQDVAAYSRYFRKYSDSQRVVMEASPGYLGEAEIVVSRIKSLLPDAKLLFILRDPIERLYSSYNFYVAKLNVPEKLSFNDFVEKCLIYDRGDAGADELGLGDWYLKTLAFGRYDQTLEQYFAHFPRSNIKVMFFESLRDDVSGFMTELSQFLGIDPYYWNGFDFRKNNITFAGRSRFFHRMAIGLNNATEPLLRQRPKLKHALVDLYKSLNQASDERKPISDSLRHQLADYYFDSNQRLAGLLNSDLPESWLPNRRKPRVVPE
jgi:hypothetical protein